MLGFKKGMLHMCKRPAQVCAYDALLLNHAMQNVTFAGFDVRRRIAIKKVEF
jgi:hypothetical protein